MSILLRVIVLVGGGYFAAAGLVALAAALLPAATGLARADAAVIATSLGFLAYLAFALWIAAERRLWRVVVVPAAVAGAGFGLAQLILTA